MSKIPNRKVVDKNKAFEALKLRLALLTQENAAKKKQIEELNAKVLELEAQYRQLNETLKASLKKTTTVQEVEPPISDPDGDSDRPFSFFNWKS